MSTSYESREAFLRKEIAWADGWLAKPESELPGALTHDKCRHVRNTAMEKIADMRISHGGFTAEGRFGGYGVRA